MVSNSPLKHRIDAIEVRMSNFVQREQYRFLQDQMIDFVTNDTFDVMIKKFNALDRQFASKNEAEKLEKELRKEMDDKLLMKLSIADFNEELTKYDAEIQEKFLPLFAIAETF